MVIRNVNVIPMTREIVLENHNVIIADGVILGVLPPDKMNQVDLPESTSYIDGTGKYLTPGFSDMHSHSSGFEEVNKLMLANGITLARDMNGSSEALEARRLMEDKVYLGPELFITTPILDGDPPFWYANYILDDPALVEDVILALLDEGYNGIKVYEHLKEDVYQEIIRVADARDVQVFGHIPVAVGIELAIDSGQDSIEHFNGYYPSSLSDELFKATIKSGVWHCPTLVVMEKYANVHIYDQKLDRGEEIPWLCYVPDEFIEYWRCSGSLVFGLEIYKDFLLKLYSSKGNIVTGTDSVAPFVIPGFSLHEEFLLFQEAGLTPYEVLLCTTVNPAKMLGYEDRLGTIERGKDADMVLLNENPLDDIGNTSDIYGVLVKGIWISEEDIQSMLDEVEQAVKKINEEYSDS